LLHFTNIWLLILNLQGMNFIVNDINNLIKR